MASPAMARGGESRNARVPVRTSLAGINRWRRALPVGGSGGYPGFDRARPATGDAGIATIAVADPGIELRKMSALLPMDRCVANPLRRARLRVPAGR